MKDIIDATGISRGGIYLYFDSVEAVFTAVIQQRSNRTYETVQQAVAANQPFETVLTDYLAGHARRLQSQLDGSLLRATYEYYFTHKDGATVDFQQQQLANTQATIEMILDLGVTQHVLKDQGLSGIAANWMFLIEGMSTLALTGGIAAAQINAQFTLMRRLLPYAQTN
ncbi:TetR family transcriptional regulator [Lacticaseibacillus brantae DSM 23927]|uniref:TetR family transcriptional regulator n=2 Tax=Lacticaseibacillus brantae TaxID=943673 RepID=A0A0R2AXA7_9LACO|nr:TetR family transcriptional regulator [Lacticaseibacillus brantae DSM 23927]